MEDIPVKDNLLLLLSSEYKEVVRPGETLLWSGPVIKINKEGKHQLRNLVITDKSLSNVGPKGNFLTGLFRKAVKRVIRVEEVKAVTISEISNCFVVHIPNEYDYSYSTPDRSEIIEYILHAQEKLGCQPLKLFVTKENDLEKFVKNEGSKVNRWPTSTPVELTTPIFKSIVQRMRSDTEDSIRGTEVILSKDDEFVSEGSFDVIRFVAKGRRGKVFLAEKKGENTLLALKIISKADVIKQNLFENLKRNKKIMHMVEHPFVAKVDYCFSSPCYIFFVMKFKLGGSLYHHLRKSGQFSEDTARFYFCQVLSALEYLHSLGIVYRDLRLENVLLDERGDSSLGDCGVSTFLEPGQKTRSFVGSPEYLAPEIILQSGHNRLVDVWCLGVMLYEMLFGRPPFFHKNPNIMFTSIIKSELSVPKTPEVSSECEDLLLRVR